MIPALVAGSVLGIGLFVVARALGGHRPALATALGGLDRRADGAGAPPLAVTHRLGHRIAALAGADTARRRRDLRITGRTTERYAVDKLAAALAGLLVPPVLALLMVSNGVAVPPGMVVALAAGLAVGGFLLPDLQLREAAKRRRAAFTAALSSYLDLVNVVLAGGAGTETALEAAAEAGDGWAFAELRRALARSRALRRSPWDCFADLGDELGVPQQLQELAASVQLAGRQGARVRSSLAAKAASLRGHQLSAVEAAAQSASERMALPTVLLFTGFLLFIGYPAVAEILGGSGW